MATVCMCWILYFVLPLFCDGMVTKKIDIVLHIILAICVPIREFCTGTLLVYVYCICCHILKRKFSFAYLQFLFILQRFQLNL